MKDLEERLTAYGKSCFLIPDESKMEETITDAKFHFYEAARTQELHYLEFMYQQVRYIRKKWWGLQFLTLFFAGCIVQRVEDVRLIQRLLGILSSLFVILLMPELWKNQSSNSLEIEEASYFSLRQIYAARMLAFAVVDGILLGVFTGTLTMTTTVTMGEMVIHFFLPMTVTACICFRMLCSPYCSSEYLACGLSLLWSAVWVLLVLDDKIYLSVSTPAWFGICCMAVFYLTYTVRKLVKKSDTDFREKAAD